MLVQPHAAQRIQKEFIMIIIVTVIFTVAAMILWQKALCAMRQSVMAAGTDARVDTPLPRMIEQKECTYYERRRRASMLLKDEQEANRKWIEQKGIAAFQTLAAADFHALLLRSKGIESTTLIAETPDAPATITGSRNESLPAFPETKWIPAIARL
jgi:hypothetical protein